MNLIDNFLRKLSSQRIQIGEMLIENITIYEKPCEFQNYAFSLIDSQKKYFGDILLSKRLITEFSQKLLKERNILILPEFIDSCAIIFAADILNKIEDIYEIHLEITNKVDITEPDLTQFLLSIRYGRILTPIILIVPTREIIKIAIEKNLDFEEDIEFPVCLLGEQYLPLHIIGRLNINDRIKIPSQMTINISEDNILNNKIRFYEEEIMQKEGLSLEELTLPVTIKIEIGQIKISKLREMVNEIEKEKLLEGKKCKIFLSNTLIAEGEINDKHIKISKISI